MALGGACGSTTTDAFSGSATGAGGAVGTAATTASGHTGSHATTTSAGSGGAGGKQATTTGSAGSAGHVGGAGGATTTAVTTTTTGVTTTTVGATTGAGGSDAGFCPHVCSPDFQSILDCHGNLVGTCTPTQACDQQSGTCVAACTAAAHDRHSVGCDFYATFMDQYQGDGCFAVYVANTSAAAAHLTVDYNQLVLPAIGTFTGIPQGFGPTLSYAAYDAATGLLPGQVAVLFLSGPQGMPNVGSSFCALPSAVPTGVMLNNQTGIGHSFHIASDAPVAAYEMNPYGGGSAAVTAASLLLPTSVWDKGYMAVTVTPYDIANPSFNIVASVDNTHVTLTPTVGLVGGGGIPTAAANTPVVITLNKGEHAQVSQQADLTGSSVVADQPIGFMAGQNCMHQPAGASYCDHGEQMIPPIHALGHEYVGVMYRPRIAAETSTTWHLVGVANNTQLTWTPNVGGPTTLAAGQVVDFVTGTPFQVTSQDANHSFMLFAYMSGSGALPGMAGYGDPDFVLGVPPQQFLSNYVIFTDPTYPETNLVVVRAKYNGAFQDVNLDCLGNLTGWQAVGDYEWTRTDLITGNFQAVGNCSTGQHELKSQGTFGLWVWGWGTPLTTIFTQNVSYGYPGGMNVGPINNL